MPAILPGPHQRQAISSCAHQSLAQTLLPAQLGESRPGLYSVALRCRQPEIVTHASCVALGTTFQALKNFALHALNKTCSLQCKTCSDSPETNVVLASCRHTVGCATESEGKAKYSMWRSFDTDESLWPAVQSLQIVCQFNW